MGSSVGPIAPSGPDTHTVPAGTPANGTTPGGAPLSPPTVPAASAAGPLVFGNYEVLAELGEGGMGRVYRAIDRNLGREVAIKVLRVVGHFEFEASRFRGEAATTAKFRHPNITQIFEIETTPDGRPYLVLEFAEGGSLDRFLKGQPQEPRRAAEWTETLARAVQYAHEQGVIHRDLKPANILRALDGTLKITDFGLAKQMEVSSGLTASGAVLGTPSYMAPEQAEGRIKDLDARTDVYGLGAILYEMLTGRPPFRGVNMTDTLEQVRWSDPASPTRLVPRLHRDLVTICLKCLQKAPGRRYQSAAALADDLRRWLNGETILARRAPTWERVWRHVRRRPWQAATLAVTVLAGSALFAGGLWLWQQEKKQEADRRLADQKDRVAQIEKKAEDDRHRRDGEYLEKLRHQGKQSLDALNGIRDLALSGELGRKGGLDQLNRRLFDYYRVLIDSQERDGGSDPAELARACVTLGDLIRRTGDKVQAREAYRKAEGLYDRLAAADPAHRPRLAEARQKLARVAFELYANLEAGPANDAALALWESLGDTPEARSGAAECYHLRGEILSRVRKLDGSAAAFGKSIELREALARPYRGLAADQLRDLPRDERAKAIRFLRDVARGYGYRGDVLLDDRRVHDADRDYWESHHVREKVEQALALARAGGDRDADADLLDARQQLARSWGNFTAFQSRARALGTARHFAERAILLQRDLVRDAPDNVEFRFDLCDSLHRVADLHLILADPNRPLPDPGLFLGDTRPDALLTAAQNLPMDDSSSGTPGWSAGARGRMAEALALRAQVLAWSIRPENREQRKREEAEARAALGDAGRLLDELCRLPQPDPKNFFLRAAVHALHAELGGETAAGVRREEAVAALRKAVALQYREKHPDDIRRMRAFRSVVGDPAFEGVLKELAQ